MTRFPVRADDSIPPGEIRLVADGKVVGVLEVAPEPRPWRPTMPQPKPNDSMTFVRQPVRDATEATLTVQHAVWNVAKGALEWRTDRIYRWNR